MLENGGAIACVVVFFFLILLLCAGTGWSNYRTYNQCKRSFRQGVACQGHCDMKVVCENPHYCPEKIFENIEKKKNITIKDKYKCSLLELFAENSSTSMNSFLNKDLALKIYGKEIKKLSRCTINEFMGNVESNTESTTASALPIGRL